MSRKSFADAEALADKSAGQARSTSSGQAVLPAVLILGTLLALIGVTLLGSEIIQTNLSTQRVFVERARNAAQSGIYDAMTRIERDTTWCPSPYNLAVGSDSTTVTIVCSTTSNNIKQRVITSASTVRTTKRTLKVTTLVSATGALHVTKREEL